MADNIKFVRNVTLMFLVAVLVILLPLSYYDYRVSRSEALELLASTHAELAQVIGNANPLVPLRLGVGGDPGQFWTEIVNWIGGQDLDTTLENIDAAWPEE